MAAEEIPDAGDLFKVRDLVAVVTGAGGGIGLLMARALEANGAKVFILDVDPLKLETAQRQSVGAPSTDVSSAQLIQPQKFGNLIAIQCDITSQKSLEDAVKEIEAQVGYINLLIANAGVPGPRPPRIAEGASLSDIVDAWWQTPFEDFLGTYSVNNAGTFYTVIAFLKLLDSGNRQTHLTLSSQIILTASITAFNRQIPSGFAYATSKAGVVHLMKQLATYLVPYNIRCNAIAPGCK